MLLDLREKVRSSKPIKYTLITIICIPFVFFGVSSYFSGGGTSYAAKVNGEEISARELEEATNQQRAQLRQMFGGQIPEGFSNEGQLRSQALESLLTQRVLRNTVEDSNFTVSDETLARTIQDIPIFQRDGQFDQELYRREMQSRGMSIDQFESSFRDDTALAQFRSGIVETSFVLPTEKLRIDELTGQVRTTDYILFPMESIRAEIEVSDEEVSSYFDENADNYQFPQRVKIDYIELSRDELATSIDISDEEAAEYYENNKGNYLIGEERKASHILLEVDDDLEEKTKQLNDIKARIEAGEDFAELATELSSDVGSAEQGGSLGQFGRGAMVPEFDETVFAMTEPGSLSDPVKTDFGVHLIQLDEIIPEHGKPYDEVKDSIVSQMQRERADTEFLDLNEILTEQSFDTGDSLEPTATSMGVDVVTSDWIDGSDVSDPVLGNPAVLNAALSDDVLVDGNNSEVITLGDKHVMVLRVLEHEDPRPKTLDDVSEELTEKLRTDKAGEQLDQAVTSATEVVESGGDLESAASDNGGTLTAAEELTRTSTTLERGVITELFELPHPEGDNPTIKASTLGSGDRVLLVLREVKAATTTDAESDGEVVDSSATEGASITSDPERGNAEFTLMLQSLREAAKVEVNESVMSGEASVGY